MMEPTDTRKIHSFIHSINIQLNDLLKCRLCGRQLRYQDAPDTI